MQDVTCPSQHYSLSPKPAPFSPSPSSMRPPSTWLRAAWCRAAAARPLELTTCMGGRTDSGGVLQIISGEFRRL